MRMRGYDSAHGGAKEGPPSLPPTAPAQTQAASAPPPAPAPQPPPLPFFLPTPSKASIPKGMPSAANINFQATKASPKNYQSTFWYQVSLTRAVGSGPTTNPAAREAMRPPKYGGYSKRDQLGSVADSWGSSEAPDEGVRRLGLFQVEPEPPSPPATPFP